MKKILLGCTALMPLPVAAQQVPAPQATAALVCAYNSSSPTIAPGNFGYVQCDNQGRPIIGTVTNGLNFTNNITYAGPSNATNSWLYIGGNVISGTPTQGINGRISPMNLYMNDNVDASASPGYLVGLQVEIAAATGYKGGRTGINGFVVVNGVPGATSGPGMVGAAGQIRVNANMLGTTGAYANYAGNTFGGNSQLIATASATFINATVGHEFDIELQTGASTADKYGISVVRTAADAVSGTYDNVAISVQNQDTVTEVGWNYGISFGAYAHKWPFTTTSTLIGVQNRQVGTGGNGGSSTSAANIGVDMTNGTFTTAQYKGTGFLVSPSGATTIAAIIGGGSAPTLSGTCTTGGQTGGNTSGTFTATCTAQTVIMTFATTAPAGWSCSAHDRTTPADSLNQTSSTVNSATLTGTTIAADVIQFQCMAY